MRALNAHVPIEAAPPKLGWLMAATGDYSFEREVLADALAAYEASRAIADVLAAADPGNAGWQRDLSVSHNKIGDVLKEQGNLPAALAAYEASRAIREVLAAADPGNAGWQRDVAVSHGKLGLLHKAKGDKSEALGSFRLGREIMLRLTRLSADNAIWKQDLANFDALIAELKGSPTKRKPRWRFWRR